MATQLIPRFRRLSALLAFPFIVTAAQAKAADHYQVIELGALGAAFSYANSVNDAGVVVGNVQYADGHVQGFIWDVTHGIRRIDLTARQSVANCINDSGIVAGAAEDQNRLIDAVLWPAIGQRNDIAWAPFGAVATCVNRHGATVGYRMDGIFDPVDRAFSWPSPDPNSAWHELFGTNHESFATAINDKGEVVGSVDRQAFLVDAKGNLRILAGSATSGPPATAVAINDKGDVLVSQMGTGCIVQGKWRLELPYPGLLFPTALNASDEVVGYVDNGAKEAFVWEKTTGVQIIDNLIDTPGWQISSANSVNRSGMIAGFGIKNGRRRAVLLVPVKGPEPHAAP